MSATHHIRTGLSRNYWSIWFAMAAIVVTSWVYLVSMAHSSSMPMWASICTSMPGLVRSDEWFETFAMWSVMMVAMMVPSTVQGLSLFAAMQIRRRPQGSLLTASSLFIGGYIVAWEGYSILATIGQVMLARAALLTESMQSASAELSALVLIMAGLFQFSSLKEACLTQCRSPLGFFLSQWRDGLPGAFIMGLRHGSFCVGCCWALMAIMWVVGLMNLLWMALLTLFVLGEKLAPAKWQISRASGSLFLMWGLYVFAQRQ